MRYPNLLKWLLPALLFAFILLPNTAVSAADREDTTAAAAGVEARKKRIRALLSRQEQPSLTHDSSDTGPSTAAAGLPLQALLDAAAPGATVSLPPGDYPGGLVIRKPVTLNMAGVRLLGVARHKGIVIVESPGGPVVINDFHGDGRLAGATRDNLAGIRVTGRQFDVTVNRARISGTAMGVLTDNRGGVLRIRNSQLVDIGEEDSEQSLSHIVYAGLIDRLEVDGSTLRRSHHLGHLLKSRAHQTLIADSQLLGDDSRHSRVIDLPCGGSLTISGSRLQLGPRADNRDMIGVGLELGGGCGGRVGEAAVAISGSVLEFAPAPGSQVDPLYVFNWQAPVAHLQLQSNELRSGGHTLHWQMAVAGPVLDLPGAGGIMRE